MWGSFRDCTYVLNLFICALSTLVTVTSRLRYDKPTDWNRMLRKYKICLLIFRDTKCFSRIFLLQNSIDFHNHTQMCWIVYFSYLLYIFKVKFQKIDLISKRFFFVSIYSRWSSLMINPVLLQNRFYMCKYIYFRS